MLANQTCSLIEHGRITTTLAKAKAVRPLAEKMVTLAKRGGLHARRRALALLHNNSTRTVKAVGKLFAEIAPRSAGRNGGYTRVVKLGPRSSDSAPMAFIEWVDLIAARANNRRSRYQELQENRQVFGRRRPKAFEEIKFSAEYLANRADPLVRRELGAITFLKRTPTHLRATKLHPHESSAVGIYCARYIEPSDPPNCRGICAIDDG